MVHRDGWGHSGETIFFYMCLHWKKYFKIFSRAIRPILIKRNTNHSCIKGIQVYANKGSGPLERGDNAKIGWGHLKFFIKNHWARKT
jgi:hypothetical protein